MAMRDSRVTGNRQRVSARVGHEGRAVIPPQSIPF